MAKLRYNLVETRNVDLFKLSGCSKSFSNLETDITGSFDLLVNSTWEKMKEVEGNSLAVRKLYHTTVFSQSFSPCGKYLAVSNNHGNIVVFSLSAALSPEATESEWKPYFTFKASEEGAIYCLASTDKFLISAGNGPICAWKWSDVLSKSPKTIWSWKIPKKEPFCQAEVNCIVIDQQDTGALLFAGCGDNVVYVWDMESGEVVNRLSGHADYIHSVDLKNRGQVCASASEDGTVKIWDMRDCREPEHNLEPYKSEKCCRPEFGRWIGCVAMQSGDDWLICGGGPRLSLWHLRSLAATAVFDTPQACQKTAIFYEDTIITGGSEAVVNHWYINGDKKSEVPCTPANVFNVAVNSASETHKVLSVAGNSPRVDICTNFGYKAFSFTCT